MVWMLIGSIVGAVLLAALATLVFGGGDFDVEHFLMWCGALLVVVILGWFVVAQLRGPTPPTLSDATGVGSLICLRLPTFASMKGAAPW